MSFECKEVLLVGATSGIGAAMADRLVAEGCKVIAVGRRQDRLDAFVEKHGSDKAAAEKFDISNWAEMDNFVSNVTRKYPNLDCVFLNAGTQHPVNLANPETVDLSAFHSEISTNFSSLVELTIKFLPFLKTKKSSLIFTGSGLAWIPAVTLPAYSASKAALSAFILCLREQLRSTSVSIIELSPPLVATELHDYMGEEKGRAMGMPVGIFTDRAYEGIASGTDTVIVGEIGPPGVLDQGLFKDVIEKRRALFDGLAACMATILVSEH